MVALLLAAGAAAPAQAVEVGECFVQSPGAYSNNACTAAVATGTYEWRQLAPPNNHYEDGHPEILLDEKQVVTGEGVKLECRGSVVSGDYTGFTTNVQTNHDYKCKLLAPFVASCANVGAEQIDTGTENGVWLEGAQGPRNRLTMAATFTCGGEEASLTGEYEGTPLTLDTDAPKPVLNKMIQKYYLWTGPGYGEQALTLTVGLQSWPVTLTGQQEDKFGSKHKVIRTGP
jgi:hypothetical protein